MNERDGLYRRRVVDSERGGERGVDASSRGCCYGVGVGADAGVVRGEL